MSRIESVAQLNIIGGADREININVDATFATAQQPIGVKGALQLSNMAVDKDQLQENNNKTGYSIGIINWTEKDMMVSQTQLL